MSEDDEIDMSVITCHRGCSARDNSVSIFSALYFHLYW